MGKAQELKKLTEACEKAIRPARWAADIAAEEAEKARSQDGAEFHQESATTAFNAARKALESAKLATKSTSAEEAEAYAEEAVAIADTADTAKALATATEKEADYRMYARHERSRGNTAEADRWAEGAKEAARWRENWRQQHEAAIAKADEIQANTNRKAHEARAKHEQEAKQ
jgi:hypothetical protein